MIENHLRCVMVSTMLGSVVISKRIWIHLRPFRLKVTIWLMRFNINRLVIEISGFGLQLFLMALVCLDLDFSRWLKFPYWRKAKFLLQCSIAIPASWFTLDFRAFIVNFHVIPPPKPQALSWLEFCKHSRLSRFLSPCEIVQNLHHHCTRRFDFTMMSLSSSQYCLI